MAGERQTKRRKDRRGGKRRTSWRKGQSGNPRGPVPDDEKRRVADLFRERGLIAKSVEVIAEILDGGKSEPARLLAAEKVLERTEGKVPLPITGGGGPPIRVSVEGAREAIRARLARESEQ